MNGRTRSVGCYGISSHIPFQPAVRQYNRSLVHRRRNGSKIFNAYILSPNISIIIIINTQYCALYIEQCDTRSSLICLLGSRVKKKKKIYSEKWLCIIFVLIKWSVNLDDGDEARRRFGGGWHSPLPHCSSVINSLVDKIQYRNTSFRTWKFFNRLRCR